MAKKIVLIALPIMLVLSFFIYLKFSPYDELNAFLLRTNSTQIKSRDGVVLQVTSLENGLKREYLSLDEIPEELKKIFIKAEDKRFYYHIGFDPVAITRAFYINIKNKKIISGASTITMQLVDIINNQSKKRQTYKSKFFEIIDAMRIEARFSKKEIILFWINSIPFGKNCEGVASASKKYFGKEVSSLDQIECILLANLLKNPSKYNPDNLNESVINNGINLAKKVNLDLQKEDFMLALENINKDDYKYPYLAPHFLNMIKIDKNQNQIITTLDYKFQKFMQIKLKEVLDDSKSNRIKDGAIVVFENKTGNILVYIGTVDYYEKNSGQINGLNIRRQPGSTLKPFLYCLAIEKGFTPATILPDIPQFFGHEEIYQPDNYNNRFNGPVRLRVALSSSLNVPAIWTLEKLGVANFTNFLIDLEFDSIKNQINNLGLGLAVGNGEVTLLELARAFSIFANDGKLVELNYIAKEVKFKNVVSQESAEIIRDILNDNSARVLGFGSDSVLNVQYDAIFKTGTSNQFNNIWALGSTPEITVGVWLGNFSGDTVVGVTGSYKPAILVREALNFATKNSTFPKSKTLILKKVCALSGKNPTKYCKVLVEEFFKKSDLLDDCDYHQNGKLVLPEIYSNFKFNDVSYSIDDNLKISSPVNGSTYYIRNDIPINDQIIKIVASSNNQKIQLFINKKMVATSLNILKYELVPTTLGKYDLEFKTQNQTKNFSIFLK